MLSRGSCGFVRILIVASYAPSLINFRGPLISALRARGHEVLASAPQSNDELAIGQELRSLGVKFIPIPLIRGGLNPFVDMVTIYRLSCLLIRHKPDLVLAYTIKPVIYVGLCLSILRLLNRSENPRFFALITGLGYAFTTGTSHSFRKTLLCQLIQYLYRLALRPVTCVIFQNLDDLALFRKLNLIPSTTKVHRTWGSGVELAAFPHQPLPSQPVFLMLARLLVDKGIREYIAAARHVKKRFPNATFRLAGMLDMNPAAITQSELDLWVREGVIEYLGDLKQVQIALAACRFYVLPSYREGTPRSVLEALATGRPVITTDAPGCRETVVHGVNGLLVPPRDFNALAAAMIQMIEQPSSATEQMARASLQLARKHFDVHKVNAQLISIMGA